MWRLDRALEGGSEVPLFLITLKVSQRLYHRRHYILSDASAAVIWFLSLTVSTQWITQVVDRGIFRNIEMLANRESLQDLLYKVKDAVKQADRVLTSLK